jgi:hypothetical protein
MGTAAPPAGWYSDPEIPMTERWWDGTVWTDARRAETPEAVPFYRSPWFWTLLVLLIVALVIWAFSRDDEGEPVVTTVTTSTDTTIPVETPTETTAPVGEATTTVAETTTSSAETTTTVADTTTTVDTTTTLEAEREPVFGDGLLAGGGQVAPGVYETGDIGSGFLGGCGWQRLADDSGDEAAVLAERDAEGHEVVEIMETDGYFDSSCDEWFELEDLEEPLTPIPEGTWVVGVHILPGTYQADGGGGCRWERLSDASRDAESIIDSQESEQEVTVEILDIDFAFSSIGCGEWSEP